MTVLFWIIAIPVIVVVGYILILTLFSGAITLKEQYDKRRDEIVYSLIALIVLVYVVALLNN